MSKSKNKDFEKEENNKKEEMESTENLTEESQESFSEDSEQSDNKNSEREEQLEKQVQELKDTVLRTAAEFDNFRKRSIKEKKDIQTIATSDCVEKILPLMDSFENALSYDCEDKEFKKGMEMILKQFKTTLTKMGIVEIDCLHKEFNPDLHNAISQIEDESLGENVVSQVCQKGYILGDKVVRHAVVIVANP